MQSVWMLLSALFFSLMAASTKWGAADYGTFALIFYRCGVGFAAIALWALATRVSPRTQHGWVHFKRCALGTLNIALWFYILGKLPLETGMTLNYTSPLFMALFVTFVSWRRKFPIDWALVAAIAVGFLGVLLVLQPSVPAGSRMIAAIGLCCGIISTMAFLQVRKLGDLHEPAWRVVFYLTLFGTVFGFFGALTEPQGIRVVPTFRGVAALLGTGLFGLFAQICLTKGFGSGSILLSSALQFSAIAFSAVISAVFFGHTISVVSMVGIAVIIAAGSAAAARTGHRLKTLKGNAGHAVIEKK